MSKEWISARKQGAIAESAPSGPPFRPTGEPPLNPAPEGPANWRGILLAILPFALLIAAAVTAYVNAWPNELVHDDKFYAGSERFASLANIPRYFSENVLATSGIVEPLYRPLLLTSITLDARAYGDWVAGYHLTNIALHATVTMLLFAFLVQLLRALYGREPTGTHAALLTTLLFAVHPVFTEVVNSVYNRSEMLVALGALAGFWWLIRYLDTRPGRAWAGLSLAYLLALLCKESAAVIPGMAALLVLMTTGGDIRTRLRKCLPVLWLLLPAAIYLALRFHALGPADVPPNAGAQVAGGGPSAVVRPSVDRTLPALVRSRPGSSPPTRGAALAGGGPSLRGALSAAKAAKGPKLASGPGEGMALAGVELPDWRRMVRVAGVWYQSLKIMVWPFPLSVAHDNLGRSEYIAGLALNLFLFGFALYQLRKNRFGLPLGLAFFYLATLPASRLIGDSSTLPHFAERYLYFPSIGLAIVLVFGLRAIILRLSTGAVAPVVLLAAVIFSTVTWNRNAAWASEVTLFETEYNNGNRHDNILTWLSAAYLLEGRFESAAALCDEQTRLSRQFPKFSTHCGIAYGRLGRMDQAEYAFRIAARQAETRALAHFNLAEISLDRGHWMQARRHYRMSVNAEQNPINRAFRRGYALARLYPSDHEKLLEARTYFEKVLEQQPAFRPARAWLARIDRALAAE